jgi:isopenicillin-N epimerase
MPTYLLDPDICFLNHGSFGATPRELLDVQAELRRNLEAEPVDFLHRHIEERINKARRPVAEFLGAELNGTVFVNNATSGVNAVVQSFPWQRGDQILTTNHRYEAVRNTLTYVAARHGAEVIEAQVPFPIKHSTDVLDAIEAAVTPRTRMMMIDQVTSPTGLIFPVKEIIQIAKSRGIAIMIDGAHAPGQIDVDLSTLGADFWVGNLHKWMCAPKGVAALYVADEWRDRIHPTVISHGFGQGLAAEFGWCGTHDPTAWLCAPDAIALHQRQGGATFRAAHHALVQTGRTVIAEALGVELPHPDDARIYGSMASIPLTCSAESVANLFRCIREEDKIEVPIIVWDNRAWVRISGFAGYNTPKQYERLAQALQSRLIGA